MTRKTLCTVLLTLAIGVGSISPAAADTLTPTTTPSLPPATVAGSATPFALRVDVGGSGLRDEATGTVWEADRPYGQPDSSGRLWGYLGPKSMQVIATSRAVAGSSVSRLYQTQRLGANGYRFQLANGEYKVTIRLAELYFNLGPGANVFDVYCQGSLKLADVDVMGSVGAYRAYDRTFTTTVSTGVLDLSFVPKKGWAAIAALEVESSTTVALVTPAQSGVTATTATPVSVTPSVSPAPTLAPSPTVAMPTVTPAVLPATATAMPTVQPTATPTPSAVLTTTPTPTASATPSATATATEPATAVPTTPTSAATSRQPTETPADVLPPTATPRPAETATATPAPSPTAEPSAIPVPTPTERPALAVGQTRINQDSFSVTFAEADVAAAQDVLDAMMEMKGRLGKDLGLSVGRIDVRLFSSRDEYNRALGTTVPADQVGNIVDPEHIWLLAPNRDNPTEYADILKGVQVEVARLALSQVAMLPLWLRDGVASYEAQLWNDAREQYMRSLVAMRRLTSLRGLDGQTYNYLGGAVTAHTVVDYLVKTYSMQQLAGLLEALRTRPLDQALRDTLSISLSDFDRAWVAYVTSTYGRR